jgi:hypothetical protein
VGASGDPRRHDVTTDSLALARYGRAIDPGVFGSRGQNVNHRHLMQPRRDATVSFAAR